MSPNDPLITWINDGAAESVERPFTIDGKSFVAEISPANFKNKKSKKFQSHFPHLREARIEYVIISMASKQAMQVQSDSENNKVFYLKTTYYQIQKEIVNAINKVEDKVPIGCKISKQRAYDLSLFTNWPFDFTQFLIQ
ncbi:hypothetical protein [Pseudoalteromonas piscicida]|uniref:Uncharacterized protein n=1 Tax=Pseudoalteromonas piscicida TaxID=43662 RepID=A0A2A5JW43_PSEO7|nr:hypothetical protein [Pseudoalteromonas piscicida]PCK33675.1 hypothetical protein CEX98_00680 [Pseudoalteromonas piscicida]